MKAYLITTGVLFGLIVLAHSARLVLEGPHAVHDPWFVGMTAAAVGLCAWAFRLLVTSK